MQSKDATERQPGRKRWLIRAALVVLVVMVAIWLPRAIVWRRDTIQLAGRLLCQVNLGLLGVTFTDYAADYNGKYPVPDKWCDLLLEYDPETEKLFRCPRDNSQLCSYALNPNCEPNSPADTVLLFESRPGWNQFGGPELINLDNHHGEGLNVLYNDGSVRFVLAEGIDSLKWKAE